MSLFLTSLLPILIASLKELLPVILRGVINNIFNPPTPIERAKTKLDESIGTGDLLGMSEINTIIISNSKQDVMSKEEMQRGLDFIK
jgi:hypothetical protein